MAIDQVLSSFYSLHSQKEIVFAFEQRIKDKTNNIKTNPNDYLFRIKYNNNKLCLYIDKAKNLLSYHLVLIRYFFPLYDDKEHCAYTRSNKMLHLIFKEGLEYFFKYNINVSIDIERDELFRLVCKLMLGIDTSSIHSSDEFLWYLVDHFDDVREMTFQNFVNYMYAEFESKRTAAVVESVTMMELPLDWTNSFVDDDRVKGTYERSVSDGLIRCLNVLGRVDIEYISSITNYSLKEVIIELGGVIYQNPLKWEETFYRGFETADEYLSGNIAEKLRIATEANNKYKGYFQRNVDALKLVKPKMVPIEDIYVTLGSPWLPTDIIDQFIDETFGCSYYGASFGPNVRNELKTIHDELTGSWEIPNKQRYSYYNIAVNKVYGTKELNALHIIEKTLNMRTIQITKEVIQGGKKKRVVDQEQTMLALEKQRLLVEKFQGWIWEDEKRKNYLIGIYEEKYCSSVIRRYDGSFLDFPGLNPDVKLYDYQKSSVARILFSPNVLLAHEVGAGKTYVMIVAGMELKRMGISKRNMYVVPNSLVGQWTEMFEMMYPNANILSIKPNMFTKDKIFETLKKVQDDDLDAVIIPYSCFDRIPISKNFLIKVKQAKIEELNESIRRKKKTPTVKQRIKSLEEEIKKLDETYLENDNAIYFEDLGINTLFVDEAHNYKNLSVQTKIMRVNGITSTGSKKCDDMYLKVRCVQQNNNGRGVIFATGTPITNSLSDIYVMQMYLQSGELIMLDLQTFDSWVGMFVEKETTFEIDVDTTNYRMVTRFSSYHNMPELSLILASIIDFYNLEDSNELPEMDGYIDVTVKQTKEFKKYLQEISARAEKIRKHKVRRKDDNLLKVTGDGRKAALDMRLVMPKLPFNYESKIGYCAGNVYNLYFKYFDEKLAQLIFCDTSTPKEGFNVYDDLKYLLMGFGIPADEIAFIHDATSDAQRNKLFESVRTGKVRILIGSTFKLGTGVNVQDKLIALHHLDIPWRPSDMIQREGRIVRQGNENEKVYIFRYITEGSFDAYSWQLLESKQRMINSLLKGCMTERMCDEVEAVVLNYGEIKALALGNPLIKRRVEINNELNRNKLLQKKYFENRYSMEIELAEIPDRIKILEEKIELCEIDMETYDNGKVTLDENERKELRTLLYESIINNELSTEEIFICEYQGFKISVPANIVRDYAYLYVEGASKYRVDVGSSEIGILIRLDNFLERLEKLRDDYFSAKVKLLTKQQDIIDELAKDNPYASAIEELKEELEKTDKLLGVNKDE